MTSSTPPRSDSAHAISPISTGGCARWLASFDQAVPLLGRLAGDPEAYDYLPSSVRRFPGPAELAAVMSRSGLEEIRYILTAGGIIALHVGVVPRDSLGGREGALEAAPGSPA